MNWSHRYARLSRIRVTGTFRFIQLLVDKGRTRRPERVFQGYKRLEAWHSWSSLRLSPTRAWKNSPQLPMRGDQRWHQDLLMLILSMIKVSLIWGVLTWFSSQFVGWRLREKLITQIASCKENEKQNIGEKRRSFPKKEEEFFIKNSCELWKLISKNQFWKVTWGRKIQDDNVMSNGTEISPQSSQHQRSG